MRQFLLILLAFQSLTAVGQNRKIEVFVNTNIEVINVLTISLYPEMLQDSLKDPWLFENTQLMRLANNYFTPYYKNKAVEKSKNLIDKLGTGIYLLGLYYEDLPTVKRKYEIPEIIWTEVSKNKDTALSIIDDFFLSASQFYRLSNFKKFQLKYKTVYLKSLAQIKQNLPDKHFIPLLEKYYGDQKNSYNIIIMPFFKSEWGMGWETSTKDGRKNIYNISAPFNKQIISHNQIKEVGFDNADKISNLCIHEFGHSFVNTLTATEPFLTNIKKYVDLYKQIESAKQYSDWQTLFNEYVVRAGEIVVMRQLGNNKFADKTKENYKDWIYLDFFITQMTSYTNERHKFKSFKDFLPTLIENLQTLRSAKK
jgi:hypothetical protein